MAKIIIKYMWLWIALIYWSTSVVLFFYRYDIPCNPLSDEHCLGSITSYNIYEDDTFVKWIFPITTVSVLYIFPVKYLPYSGDYGVNKVNLFSGIVFALFVYVFFCYIVYGAIRRFICYHKKRK